MFGDARHDLTPVDTRVDSQLQQLLGLGDLLGRKNGRNTYIHALEIVERYTIFLRINILRRLYRQICLFGRRQLIELRLDNVVLDLLEKQLGVPIR